MPCTPPAGGKHLTIIIPAYNDALGLKTFLPDLIAASKRHGWEIIVVNDGSTDDTANVLSQYAENISIITNDPNMGYGASLKRGIIAATTPWVACMDADGQHRIEDLEKMHAMQDDVDAILGERVSTSHAPMIRRPGKWVLIRLARLITGKNVTDFNCGLRLFKRDIVLQILSISSDRFSFSTSTTVALMQLGFRVKFVPVIVEQRIGKSTVKQIRDGLDAILRIIRLICLFHPLRIFLPIGIIMLTAGFIKCVIDVFFTVPQHISSSTLLLLINGCILFFMALLADQISGLRRDLLFRRPPPAHISNLAPSAGSED